MRHTTSTLFAIAISLMLFLGMSYLVNKPLLNKSNDFEMIDFTHVKEMKQPHVKEPNKVIEKPVKKHIKNPPTAPALDVSQTKSRDSVLMPVVADKQTKTHFKDLMIPTQFDISNKPGSGGNSDLSTVFNIAPMYPIEARRKLIEGWVKVQFVVNEKGKVIKAKILDSHPKNVFDRETLKAVYKSKFNPMIVDSKAVSQTAIQVIEFKLNQ